MYVYTCINQAIYRRNFRMVCAIFVCVYMYIHIRIIYINTCIHTYICIYVYVFICVYIYG